MNSVTEAVYRESEVRHYKDNPFIEALPAPLDGIDLARALQRPVDFRDEDRAASERTRVQYLKALITLFYEPLPQTLTLACELDDLIRTGYVHRNPARVDFSTSIDARVAALSDHQNIPNLPRETEEADPLGLTVIGWSGVGKTRAIKAALSLLPQTIRHEEYKGRPLTTRQVVHVHVQIPTDLSLKALCRKILESIDRAAGTEFQHHFSSSRVTTQNLLSGIARICSYMGVGVIVFDEIQNLAANRSGGEVRLLNFFVEFTNTVHVPIVLVGTPKALPLLTAEFQLARRGCTFGDLVWEPMRPDRRFETFCRALWRYQYVRNPVDLSPDILDVLYDCSVGVTSLIVALFVLGQKRAIETRTETLTPEILRSTSVDAIRTLYPTLGAIREKKTKVLKRLHDIRTLGMAGELPPPIPDPSLPLYPWHRSAAGVSDHGDHSGTGAKNSGDSAPEIPTEPLYDARAAGRPLLDLAEKQRSTSDGLDPTAIHRILRDAHVVRRLPVFDERTAVLRLTGGPE
jgi:hypothetical protein